MEVTLKGKATDDSDIDVLMIYYGDERLFVDSLSEISFDTALKFGELIEPIPISIYEYRARSCRSFFLNQAEKEKVLYKMDDKEANDYLSLKGRKRSWKKIHKALILRGKARYDPKAEINEQDAKIVINLCNELLQVCSEEIKRL